VKFNTVAEQQGMVTATSLLQEKESKNEEVRIQAMVQAASKLNWARLGEQSPPPARTRHGETEKKDTIQCRREFRG
jgi:hypothetical protein